MKNVDVCVSGDTLVIKVNLAAARTPSKSGKSEVLGSTEGNQPIPGFPEIRFGLNVFETKPKAAK